MASLMVLRSMWFTSSICNLVQIKDSSESPVSVCVKEGSEIKIAMMSRAFMNLFCS